MSIRPAAYEELKLTGQIGPAFLELLGETISAVVRFGHYPPPDTHELWSEDAAAEAAQEFLAYRNGPSRVAALHKRSIDESTFERSLEKAVRNWFRTLSRATAHGSIARSIATILSQDIGAIRAGRAGSTETWALPDFEHSPQWGGRIEDLVDAVTEVEDVQLVRWRVDAAHRSPVAERESFARILAAALSRAGGPVELNVIVDVVLIRFPLADDPTVDELSAGDLEQISATDDPSAKLLAYEIWDQLPDRARVVVGMLDGTVQEVVDATGLSRGTAFRAMQSAKELLADALPEMSLDVARILMELSDMARRSGMKKTGLAYEPNVRDE